MRSDQPRFHFTLLDREFFESLDRYQPGDELMAVVREQAGEGWVLRPGGFWSYSTPRGYRHRVQGWKIHVSSTRGNAAETLRRVVPVLVEEQTPFKFCSDTRMVALSTGKNWPRSGAGKFITVYPRSDEDFPKLLERLHDATAGLYGPYILSDCPYRESRVVFYRYGEHLGAPRMQPSGQLQRAILGPDGKRYSDERKAYYTLPPWVQDPFAAEPLPTDNGGEVWLKDGRYRVTHALKFSSVGGIYEAEDTHTGAAVVIREARPMLSERDEATDAVGLLEKEGRILSRLQETGLAPQFVDLFQEWEHTFLVQEKLQDVESLWGYAIGFTQTMERERTPAEAFEVIRATMRELIRGLETIHAHGVVLRDMTKTNVMFTSDGRVKFIDFEFAFELDRDDPSVAGWTPGYASPDQLRNRRPTPQEDHYALGALILDSLSFTASGLPLNREGILGGLALVLEDQGLPAELRTVVAGLLDPEPDTRWRPHQVLAALDEIAPPPAGHTASVPREPDAALRAELAETLEGTAAYIRSRLDLERGDRLWPASGELFLTNPISLQFGAAGTGLFLLRAGGGLPGGVADWVVERARRIACPPALYTGLSGVALFLLEAGRPEEAAEIMALSDRPDEIHEVAGLHWGAAGWGLAALTFWRRTGERRWLDRALEVGERLIEDAREEPAGLCWPTPEEIPVGLGFGGSGVAAFLTYLYAASPHAPFVEAAEKALEFELAEAQALNTKVLWYPRVGAKLDAPKSPHIRHGSAGVGAALLRFHALTGEPRYREWAERCAATCTQRTSNKLWYDYGMSGYGHFLVDMHRFLGEERYLNDAFHVATALLPHRMPREGGIAFPGAELIRISCDYGMGSAGIGEFLLRLLDPRAPHLFFPDEFLLGGTAVHEAGAEAGAALALA